MMPGQKGQSESLRIGLALGYRSVEDVVAWAHSVIEADANPDAAIIEVVLAHDSSPAEMEALLRNVAGVCDSIEVARDALGSTLEAPWAHRCSPAEMASSLRIVAEVCGPIAVMRYALGVMLRVLDGDQGRGQTFALALYELAAGGFLPNDLFGSEPYYLDDVFEHNGHGEGLVRLREYLCRESSKDPHRSSHG
jgi:hypothetical protein